MRPLAALSVAAVLLGVLTAPAFAAPSNDFFASATELTGNRATRTSDSNLGAGAEPAEPQHAGLPGGASVWYVWTPAAGGSVTISTAGSTFDTLLAVYVGTPVGSLAPVISNDDDPNHPVLTSIVHFDALAGTSYRIAVDGYAGDQGSIKLRLAEGPPSTTRVSVSDLDAEANNDSEAAGYSNQTTPAGTTALNTTGSVVAFSSDASNLIQPTSDSNGCTDVFIRTPGLGTTQRVSLSDQEAQGNDCTWDPAVSGTGSLVAFSSDADNLILPTADGNGCTDVFVRDTSGMTTRRVSVTNAGAQANDCSQNPALSSDGNVVAFESWATNLVAPASNGNLHIFVRNLTSATTIQATKTSGGAQANNNSDDPSLNSDGRYVVYESRATNLGLVDTNGVRDIYMTDIQSGAITRISAPSGGAESDAASRNPAISADGRYVAFESDASNFIASDSNGATDVFLHDNLTGTTSRVSVRSSGTQAKSDSYDPQISADGRYVVFSSDAANLSSNDTNAATDVFLHDTLTGITTRLSVDAGGNEGGTSSYYPSISGDHTQVAFTSDADNLVAGDTLGHSDVFERPVAYQADALVKKSTSASYTGNGVYETTATSQKLPVVKVRRGTSTTFNLQFQNDGSVGDAFTVSGCGNSKGFAVAYRAGSTTVTPAVTAGTHTTGVLGSDDAASLDVTVTVTQKAAVGKLMSCSIIVTSSSDAAWVDAVATQVKAR